MKKDQKQSTMIEMLKCSFPESCSKELIDFINQMNRKKAAAMIAKGIKPKWSDFWGS